MAIGIFNSKFSNLDVWAKNSFKLHPGKTLTQSALLILALGSLFVANRSSWPARITITLGATLTAIGIEKLKKIKNPWEHKKNNTNISQKTLLLLKELLGPNVNWNQLTVSLPGFSESGMNAEKIDQNKINNTIEHAIDRHTQPIGLTLINRTFKIEEEIETETTIYPCIFIGIELVSENLDKTRRLIILASENESHETWREYTDTYNPKHENHEIELLLNNGIVITGNTITDSVKQKIHNLIQGGNITDFQGNEWRLATQPQKSELV